MKTPAGKAPKEGFSRRIFGCCHTGAEIRGSFKMPSENRIPAVTMLQAICLLTNVITYQCLLPARKTQCFQAKRVGLWYNKCKKKPENTAKTLHRRLLLSGPRHPAESVPSFRSEYGSYAQSLCWVVPPIAPDAVPWPSLPRRGSSAASNRRFSPISLAAHRIPCSLTRFPDTHG